MLLVTLMLVETTDGASVTVTYATTPAAMVFVLRPSSTQLYTPGLPAQVRDFPTALDAFPTATESAIISTGE